MDITQLLISCLLPPATSQAMLTQSATCLPAEHLAMSPAMGKAATTPEPSLGQSERDAEEAAQLDQLAEEVTGGDQTAGKKGKAAARVSGLLLWC